MAEDQLDSQYCRRHDAGNDVRRVRIGTTQAGRVKAQPDDVQMGLFEE